MSNGDRNIVWPWGSICPQATADYLNDLNRLIQEENALKIAGVILFSEHSIPAEFGVIASGLTQQFPGMDKKGRHYIDDHIGHDQDLHCPALESALKRYSNDQDALTMILSGVDAMARARRGFYRTLKGELENM